MNGKWQMETHCVSKSGTLMYGDWHHSDHPESKIRMVDKDGNVVEEWPREIDSGYVGYDDEDEQEDLA